MTLTLLWATAWGLASFIFLRLTLRRALWLHVGTYFVIAALIYHVLSEILIRGLLLTGGPDRRGLATDDIDAWLFWAGPAIGVATFAYVAFLGPRRADRQRPTTIEAQRARDALNPIILLGLTIPAYLQTIFGRALSSGLTDADYGASNYLAAGLVAQFLLPLVVLSSFSIVMRWGRRLLPHVAVAQSAALALIGQRNTAIVGLVVLGYLVARQGIVVRRRSVLALAAVLVIVSFTLSATRELSGREVYAAGQRPTSRLSATASGLRRVVTGHIPTDISHTYVARMDGNNFAALAAKRVREGYPWVRGRTVRNDVVLAVPSLILPTKTLTDPTERSEEAYIERHFAMGTINRLPTALGTISTYRGAVWLLAGAAAFGAFFGLTGRWLARHTPGRLVLGVALLTAVCSYEGSPAVYLLDIRGGLVIVGLMALTKRATRAFVRRRATSPHPLRHATQPMMRP